jgi:O-antigen/teichoic acid export membrane protein
VPLFFGSRVGDQAVAAQWVVALLGAGLAINFQCEVFSGVLTGSHRWDLHNALTAGTQLFTAAAMIATLYLGGGLRGIALAHAGGAAVGEAVRIVVTYRVCPELELRLSRFSLTQARSMLSFGAKSWVAGLARMLLVQTNYIVVATVLGPAMLALYARPSALLRVGENVVSKLAVVLAPTASSLQGTGQHTEIRKLLLTGTRAAAALAVPMTLGLVILGGPLLQVWMGPRYDQGVVLAILALASAPALTLRPAVSILTGLNLHGFIAFASLGAAIIGVALSVLNVAVLGLGLPGAAMAFAVPTLTVRGIVVPIYVSRRLGITLRVLAREGYARPIACCIPFAIVLLACRVLLANRPLAALLAGGLLGGLVLAPLYWKFLLPSQVRRLLLSVTPRGVLARFGMARP